MKKFIKSKQFFLGCFFSISHYLGAIESFPIAANEQINISAPINQSTIPTTPVSKPASSPPQPTAPTTPANQQPTSPNQQTIQTNPNLRPKPIEHSIEEDKKTMNPGIVANRDGEWVWSDHLLNLSNNIDITVEITKPENINISITSAELKAIVEQIFRKEGINPVASPAPGKPDLPSFHILILIYPIKDGYSCAVTGRLFEQVTVDRIKLDETVTMQAITWDRSSIHVVSSGKLKDELIESVTEVATDFVERYHYFQQYKNQR